MGIKSALKQKFLRLLKGTVQKRLDYPDDARLLIIHADDLGLSGSENAATLAAFNEGMVSSGSIMVPCPAFDEAMELVTCHPEYDVGVHLTLTSEWESCKWGPLTPSADVPSLTDKNGYFYPTTLELRNKFKPGDVEREFRAQINTAKDKGLDITHLDSHMFAAFSDEEILKVYIRLGREYKVPVLLTYDLPFSRMLSPDCVVVDRLYYAEAGEKPERLKDYYTKVIESLEPGLNCLLVHLAFNNRELQDITLDKSDYGSLWRQADYDFFTGSQCRRLLKDNKIKLITWREIRDRLVRKN